MKVKVEYEFIFEPAETWSAYSQLDADLFAWLDGRGLQAEFVRTYQAQPNQSPPKKLLIISKKPDPLGVANEPVKSIKQVKAQLMQNKGYDGKFKKQ